MKRAAEIAVLVITAILLGACSVFPETKTVTQTPTAPVTESRPSAPTVKPIENAPKLGEHKKMTLHSAGKKREFIISVPKAEPVRHFSQGWPVIFAFHGWNQDAASMRTSSNLDKANALVIYAAGIDKAWQGGPYAETNGTRADERFVRDVLERVSVTYPIEANRVYAAGMSNGGGFASLLSCRMPEIFAGIASVSAAYYTPIYNDCTDQPIAVLDIHGTSDPVVGYYGGTRHGVTYRSVPEVLADQAKRNRCAEIVETSRMNQDTLQDVWLGCTAPLRHVRLGGGKHVWPGADSDNRGSTPRDFATDEILRFFDIDTQ